VIVTICWFVLCPIVTYICNHLCLRDGVSYYMYFSLFLSTVFYYCILHILFMGYEPAIEIN